MANEPFRSRITRLLDQQRIAYRLLPHSEPVFTVAEAAAQRGVRAEEMVKSILLRETGSDRYVMACLLGEDRLDYRAVGSYLAGEWRRLTFASDEEISTITGYVRGAVAPLDLPAGLPVVFDESVAHCENVNISSGDPMMGLELTADDLIYLAGAALAPISRAQELEPNSS